MISHTKKEMTRMAKALNFVEAGKLKEELMFLEKKLKDIKKRTK